MKEQLSKIRAEALSALETDKDQPRLDLQRE